MHEVSWTSHHCAARPTHTSRVPSATGSLQCMPRPASCRRTSPDSPPQVSIADELCCGRTGQVLDEWCSELEGPRPLSTTKVASGLFQVAQIRYAVMVRVTVGICRWNQWCHLRPYAQQTASRTTIASLSSPSSHSLAGGHTAASTSTSRFPIQPEVGHSSDCAAAAATRVS